MAKSTSSSSLTDRINQLQKTRQEHERAIAVIDGTLKQIADLLGGVGAAPAKAPAATATPKPVAPPKAARRRGRRRFPVSAEDSVVNFIREKGNPTTAEIGAHWESEGRGGSADKVLSTLFASKKIKREKIPNARGSRYSLTGKAKTAASATVPAKPAKASTASATSQELVLEFIKQAGNPTTAEVNAHWKKQGKPGRANKVLGRLYAAKRIKREQVKGGRGSRYTLA